MSAFHKTCSNTSAPNEVLAPHPKQLFQGEFLLRFQPGEDLGKSRHQRLVEHARGFDLPVMFHTCGAVAPIVEDLIDIGVDILKNSRREIMEAAVLAALVRFVFTVERVSSLARSAKKVLDALGIENVSVKVMDGTLGWRAQAPYDGIIVTAGAPAVPGPLIDQLADGGRLVVPVGKRESQVITVVERRGRSTFERELQDVCFVPLIGRHGWDETPR